MAFGGGNEPPTDAERLKVWIDAKESELRLEIGAVGIRVVSLAAQDVEVYRAHNTTMPVVAINCVRYRENGV